MLQYAHRILHWTVQFIAYTIDFTITVMCFALLYSFQYWKYALYN